MAAHRSCKCYRVQSQVAWPSSPRSEVGKSSFTLEPGGEETVAEVSPPKTAGFKVSTRHLGPKMEIVGDILNTNFEWDPSRQDPARR